MSRKWTHLVRFLAEEDGQIHLGQVDAQKWPDVGLATFKGEKVDAKLVTGSVYDGVVTNRTMHISQVPSHLIHTTNNTLKWFVADSSSHLSQWMKSPSFAAWD